MFSNVFGVAICMSSWNPHLRRDQNARFNTILKSHQAVSVPALSRCDTLIALSRYDTLIARIKEAESAADDDDIGEVAGLQMRCVLQPFLCPPTLSTVAVSVTVGQHATAARYWSHDKRIAL